MQQHFTEQLVTLFMVPRGKCNVKNYTQARGKVLNFRAAIVFQNLSCKRHTLSRHQTLKSHALYQTMFSTMVNV